MSISFQWEENLLSLALKALEYPPVEETYAPGSSALLEKAYQRCEAVTKENSKTFYMASNLLPEDRRRAVQALYAFCRVTDDIVDRAGTAPGGLGLDPGARLKSWEQRVQQPIPSQKLSDPTTDTLVALAWQDARMRHQVPVLYSEQLIDGVAYDLKQTRITNFADLAAYSYGVACTVGLMSMHIVGHSGPEAIPYAIRLGVALQLTNILRDVGEDWRIGRLYLPRDEMDAFQLSEEDIQRGVVTPQWREFMRFQIERVRILYATVSPGYGMLSREGRFAIMAAGELYRSILNEIERNDYDVFSRRAVVSKVGKIRRLPGIWWRSRTLRNINSTLPPAVQMPDSLTDSPSQAQKFEVDA